MILKSLRIAAFAVAFVGSAVAAQAAETAMMDKSMPMDHSAGSMKSDGAKHMKPKKRPMKHSDAMSHPDTMKPAAGDKKGAM